jgi:hypothetical protein
MTVYAHLQTALHKAIELNNRDICAVLLQSGGDITDENGVGQVGTLFFFTIIYSYLSWNPVEELESRSNIHTTMSRRTVSTFVL